MVWGRAVSLRAGILFSAWAIAFCSATSVVGFPSHLTETVRTASSPNPNGSAAGVSCIQSPQNCRPPVQFDALLSNRANFRTADNFSPVFTGSVSNVCWWGAYLGAGGTACGNVLTNTFEVRYFADSGGIPGPLLASFSQAAGTLTLVGPTATGAFIDGDISEYAYSATHAGLVVNQATQYWVEISNLVPRCTWYWETSATNESRAVQDGTDTPEPTPPNGYGPEDIILNDLAFCLNVPLPPPPANNLCDDAEVIIETGEFAFDNTFASTDGPAHAACDVHGSGQRQLTHDVWYSWTSPCTDTVYVRTCGLTEVDTRLAVYRGGLCPPSRQNLVACDDDLCGRDSDFQSMVRFEAAAGQSYLIRLGTYPLATGGSGSFEITCGPPSQATCGAVEAGSCCDSHATGGCADEACCESVCACDPFCCEVAWDEDCSGLGFQSSRCGAESMCGCKSVCGAIGSVDCCIGGNTPGCSDRDCCERVCRCDPYCCTVEWDINCATNGIENECGAAILCQATCNPQCPQGPVRWFYPPQTVLDARRPFAPDGQSGAEGIQTLHVEAPPGADKLECWSLCETTTLGGENRVASFERNVDGTLMLNLLRPITRGAVTKISYEDDHGFKQGTEFTAHPANANGDGLADASDVIALHNELLEQPNLPPGPYRRDINRSGMFTPADLLELIDLLNGTADYIPWNGTPKPLPGAICP